MLNPTSSIDQSTPPSQSESRRFRLLIVDDNPEVAECLALLLETLGHETAVAHCAADAIESARRFMPDTMLIDIGMPEISGYELAKRLRADRDLAGIRLIALSGYGQEEDRRRAQEAGFDTHLTKPASGEALESVIRRTALDMAARPLRPRTIATE
jgi:CheY-like chemotaxis protein